MRCHTCEERVARKPSAVLDAAARVNSATMSDGMGSFDGIRKANERAARLEQKHAEKRKASEAKQAEVSTALGQQRKRSK